MRIQFDTSNYEFSYGVAPRGRGSWAFAFEGHGPLFSPSMTFGEPKKWVQAEVAKRAPAGYARIVIVEVLT